MPEDVGPVAPRTEAQKAAAWDKISEAWKTYCKEGAGTFDWDFDSRTLMMQLTDEPPFQWVDQ